MKEVMPSVDKVVIDQKNNNVLPILPLRGGSLTKELSK
jgi:hypothetical protein